MSIWIMLLCQVFFQYFTQSKYYLSLQSHTHYCNKSNILPINRSQFCRAIPEFWFSFSFNWNKNKTFHKTITVTLCSLYKRSKTSIVIQINVKTVNYWYLVFVVTPRHDPDVFQSCCVNEDRSSNLLKRLSNISIMKYCA